MKLGGAAITNKQVEYSLREKILEQAFMQLREFSEPLIIVHGAGSFAHNLAKEYKLAKGRSEDVPQKTQFEGIVKTRRSLLNLHNSVLDFAIVTGLLPFSFPVSSIFYSKDHETMESTYFEALDKAIGLGFTPILYGDISFDKTNQFRVISGDRIIKELCYHFGSRFDSIRILFGTNVDGIFDRDPELSGAKLIERITNKEIESLLRIAGESAGTDVTGGMHGKLEEIQSISRLGHRVQIFNLTTPGRLMQVLSDNLEIMTDILPELKD